MMKTWEKSISPWNTSQPKMDVFIFTPKHTLKLPQMNRARGSEDVPHPSVFSSLGMILIKAHPSITVHVNITWKKHSHVFIQSLRDSWDCVCDICAVRALKYTDRDTMTTTAAPNKFSTTTTKTGFYDSIMLI